jgi:AcrR family transcriptional regulator
MKQERVDKQQRVLATTIKLFTDAHDVRKVSVEDIAGAAGVSPTTIYNWFGTRDNLVNEVVRALTLQTLGKNRSVVDSDLPFPQKLAMKAGFQAQPGLSQELAGNTSLLKELSHIMFYGFLKKDVQLF